MQSNTEFGFGNALRICVMYMHFVYNNPSLIRTFNKILFTDFRRNPWNTWYAINDRDYCVRLIWFFE